MSCPTPVFYYELTLMLLVTLTVMLLVAVTLGVMLELLVGVIDVVILLLTLIVA